MESKFIPVRGNPSSPTKNTDYPFWVIGIFLFPSSLFPHSLLFPFETCRFRESVIVNSGYCSDTETPGKCTELKKIWIASVNTAKKNRT